MIRGIVLEDILDGDDNVVLPEGAVIADDGFSDHVQCLSTGDLIYLDDDELAQSVAWDEEESLTQVADGTFLLFQCDGGDGEP